MSGGNAGCARNDRILKLREERHAGNNQATVGADSCLSRCDLSRCGVPSSGPGSHKICIENSGLLSVGGADEGFSWWASCMRGRRGMPQSARVVYARIVRALCARAECRKYQREQ